MPVNLYDLHQQLLGLQQQSQNLGAARRSKPLETVAPTEATDSPLAEHSTASEFSKGAAAAVQSELAGAKALKGIGQYALGDEAGALDTFKQSKEQEDFAASRGQRVKSIGDVHSVGDTADYLAGLAGVAAPTVASALIPGGIGGKIGEKVAIKGAVKAAEKIGADVAEKAAADGALKLSAEVAQRQGAEAAKRAAIADAAETATADAFPGAMAAAKPAIEQAQMVGQVAGSTVGFLPTTAASNADVVLDQASPDSTGKRVAKVAAGDVVGSVLGSLPVSRLLGKAGEGAVATTARELLPRVAKEAGKEGLAMGAAGAATTAVELATHKWVNDNVDLMSPEAIDAYLNSFIGGAVLGAAAGGSVEAAKARPAAPEVLGKVKEGLARLRGNERAGQPVEPAAPGEPPTIHPAASSTIESVLGGIEDPGARKLAARAFENAYGDLHEGFSPERVPDLLTRAMGHALDDAKTPQERAALNSAFGDALSSHAEQVDVSSADRFNQRLDEVHADEDLDATATRLLDDVNNRHQAFMNGEAALSEKPRYDSPIKFTDKLERALASFIPRDSGIWKFAEMKTVKSMVKSAAKLFGDEPLTAEDRAHLNLMKQAVGAKTVERWAALGPLVAERWRAVRGLKAEPEVPAAERVRPADLSHTELHDRMATAQGEELASLQKEARSRLANSSALLTERRNTAKAREWWKQKIESAATVRIEDTQVDTRFGKEDRGQMIDLANLVNDRLKENPGDPAAALTTALGDLKLAGVHVDPESFKPGVVKTIKGENDEAIPILRILSSGDKSQRLGKNAVSIDTLRKAVEQKPAPERLHARDPRALPTAETKAEVAATREPRGLQFDTGKPEVAETGFDRRASSGELSSEAARVPRRAPPEGPDLVRDGREKEGVQKGAVSSTEPVRDVQLSQPHEKTIVEYVKAMREAKTAAERAQITHEAGVKIGEKELEKWARAQGKNLNERTYNRLLTRLRDPDTKISRSYVERAGKGEFDSASVREARADKPVPDTSKRHDAVANVERQVRALRQARGENGFVGPDEIQQEIFRAAHSPQAKNERATSAKAAHEAIAQGKEPAPRSASEKLLDTARAARDLVTEDHPVARALDALDQRTAAGKERALKDLDTAANRSNADDDIDIGVKEAAGSDEHHDHVKETRMLNAVLDQLGVAEKVSVRPLTDPNKSSMRRGEYDRGSKTVYVNPNLRGKERLSVLLHELGHHIIDHEFAKASPEIRAAIEDAHAQWQAEHFQNLDTPVSEVRASRATKTRGDAVRANSNGRTLRELAGSDPHGFEYLFHFDEFVADHLARALEAHPRSQSVFERFIAGLGELLRKAYDKLFSTTGDKYKAHASVEKWVESLFDRTKLDADKALGRSTAPEEARAGTAAAIHAAYESMAAAFGGDGARLPPNGAATEAFRNFLHYQLTPDQNRILERFLERRVVVKQLQEYFGKDVVNKLIEEPAHGKDNLKHLAYTLWARGELKTGPHTTEVLLGIKTALFRLAGIAGNNDFGLKIFEDIQNGRIARAQAAGREYDPRAAIAREKTGVQRQVQESINTATGIARKYVADPWRELGGPAVALYTSGVQGLRELAAMGRVTTGQARANGDRGVFAEVPRQKAVFRKQIEAVMSPLSKHDQIRVLERLQTRAPLGADAVDTAAKDLRTIFDDLHSYAGSRGLDVHFAEKYFPVVMNALRVRGKEARFRKLLDDVMQSNVAAEAAARDYFEKVDGHRYTEPYDELVNRLYKIAAESDQATNKDLDPNAAPGMRAAHPRVMQFIYDHGTPEQVAKFAHFQSKNPADIFWPYTHQIVQKAEFTHVAGKDGQRALDLIEKAKRQGASEAQLEYARAYVEQLKGHYGADGSPFLRKHFPTLAKLYEGDNGTRARKVQSFVMAYQNARVLPLAALSSIADPTGILVRAGGKDFAGAWDSLKAGIKAMRGKDADSQYLRELGDALGSATDIFNEDSLNNGFGAEASDGWPRKVNNFVFHWNGLEYITKMTRYAALNMAQRFLLHHAAGKDANNSARYLNELNVKASDVRAENGRLKLLTESERAAATPEARAADDRVKNALAQFVDEAVLRPDASQRPMFFNDPAFALMTQYKSFAYAFQAQILNRIGHELKYSNYHVLAPAAAYLPITLMAELLRGTAQYGPSGNPNRDNWGPEEWTQYTAQRSGLLGPRATLGIDVLEGKAYAGMSHLSDLGPTVGEARDIAAALSGDKPLGTTAEEVLPASTLWQHWDDQL